MKKKISFTTEKQLEGLGWVTQVMNFGVSLTIAAAFNELYTAHMMLRSHDELYKKQVKKLANDALRHAELKRGQMLAHMESRKFYEAYSDKVIDLAEDDITKFRISIKQTLDDVRYQNAELISYIETARALLDAATIQFREVIRTAKEDYGEYTCDIVLMPNVNPRFANKFTWEYNFSEFNIISVLKSWENVCDILYGHSDDINLNTPRSTKLFDMLCTKFAEGDYVHACMDEAHELCPDFLENHIIIKDNNNGKEK